MSFGQASPFGNATARPGTGAFGSNNSQAFGQIAGNAGSAFGGGSGAFASPGGAFGSTNNAFTTGNSAFGTGNSAFGTGSGSAFGNSAPSLGTGNAAFGTGNGAFGASNSAFGTGNTAFGTGSSGFGVGSTAFGSGTAANPTNGATSPFGAGAATNSTATAKPAFGSTVKSSPFGQLSGSTNIFAALGDQSSQVHNNAPQAQKTDPFSAFSQGSTSQNSPFANLGSTSAFGNSGESAFGHPRPGDPSASAQGATSAFGSSGASFGSPSGPFGNTNAQSAFSSSGTGTVSAASPFESTSRANAFGQAQGNTSANTNTTAANFAFGQAPATNSPSHVPSPSTFGGASSPFGSGTLSPGQAINGSTNAFGNTATAGQSAFANPGSAGSTTNVLAPQSRGAAGTGGSLYVQGMDPDPLPSIDSLTTELKSVFEAPEFELGNVPETLPPAVFV